MASAHEAAPAASSDAPAILAPTPVLLPVEQLQLSSALLKLSNFDSRAASLKTELSRAQIIFEYEKKQLAGGAAS